VPLLFAEFWMQVALMICCAQLQPCVQVLSTTSLAAPTLRCEFQVMQRTACKYSALFANASLLALVQFVVNVI
jgi:hypothetical protein